MFDTLFAQDAKGEALRSGLLGMASGLLQGSTGNYGQFGPALGQGFAGFGQGMQNAQQTQMQQQQIGQQAKLRALQAKQLENEIAQQSGASSFFQPSGAQANPMGAGGDDIQARIEAGLTSPNPEVRKWALDAMRLRLQQTGGMSGLVPTQQGYAYRDSQGNMVVPSAPDGKPFMPVSALAQDPTRQGDITYAKETAKSGVARSDAQIERDRQNQQRLQLFDEAESLLPTASNGALSNLWTAAGDAAGLSTDASKADAQLRVIAGQMLGMVPRFEGPQSDKDVQAYREMAGDLANPLIPIETRLATLRSMRQIVSKYQGGAPEGNFSPSAQPSPVSPQPAIEPFNTGPSGPVRVTGADDYGRLPSGAQYLDPNGQLRTKR
ncbi:MAG: hypothetical protein WBF88_17475 [Pusillimonas sp.]